jgi:hypothetical protein|tara:strand:- start:562 stop:1719 length:1158 start_codon:yes stop_codon:yes gene_type:complete
MTSSTIASGNKTTRFQKDVRREYVRGGVFGSYIGNDINSVIQTNKNLKKVSLPLVAKIGGGGVKGSSQLSGSEQPLSNYAQTMQPTYFRQGVLVDNEENELAEFDLFSEARPALMNWAMELKRDQIIQALCAIEAGGTYYNWGGSEGAFGSTAASAANMDTWDTNNGDRIIYGKTISNRTAGDVTTSLATLDNTNDKLTAALVTLAKRRANLANPHIRPIKVTDGSAWYVMFVGSFGFRDLKEDSTITQANREARPRSVKDNPIFVDGDLLYDGVIIKEVPDMDLFTDGGDADSIWSNVWGSGATGDGFDNAGAGSIRVAPAMLCGAQAIGFAMGRNASFARRKEDDYGHLSGVGVSMKHDIKKTFYNGKQHGMVTVFHAAVADT